MGESQLKVNVGIEERYPFYDIVGHGDWGYHSIREIELTEEEYKAYFQARSEFWTWFNLLEERYEASSDK